MQSRAILAVPYDEATEREAFRDYVAEVVLWASPFEVAVRVTTARSGRSYAVLTGPLDGISGFAALFATSPVNPAESEVRP